jgi:hypothetical protein
VRACSRAARGVQLAAGGHEPAIAAGEPCSCCRQLWLRQGCWAPAQRLEPLPPSTAPGCAEAPGGSSACQQRPGALLYSPSWMPPPANATCMRRCAPMCRILCCISTACGGAGGRIAGLACAFGARRVSVESANVPCRLGKPRPARNGACTPCILRAAAAQGLLPPALWRRSDAIAFVNQARCCAAPRGLPPSQSPGVWQGYS